MKRFLLALLCAVSALWLLPACGPSQPKVNVAAHLDALKGTDNDAKANALGEIAKAGPGAAAAVPQLIELLKDPDPLIRRLAAYALFEIGPPAAKPALPELRKLLQDENREVITQALNSVRKIDPTGPEAKMAIPNVSTE
ncbi:MAG: HEAT repeat domain-containing protein [Verrucomicrobia bacterium]|jgi:HEAT repeat protein|nr:HEAT repeat domain-containing protein [Verrucomicrobiota bacterium]